MISVCVHVGTRADLFPLKAVLIRLQMLDEYAVTVLTSVGFSRDGAKSALQQAGVDLDRLVHIHIGADLESTEDPFRNQANSRLVSRLNRVLIENQFDVAVILGDRWELLYIVPGMVLGGIRIVHLHGGEITMGAVDDRIRHAVTKLSDFHCVSTPMAALRLRNLAEDESRIVVTGAPGLDNFDSVTALSEEEFALEFSIELLRPLGIVTIHPETATESDSYEDAVEILNGLDSLGTVIITHPGFDAGREEILRAIHEYALTNGKHTHVSASLGTNYSRVMQTADVMVGNSSSGIIEAASFGLPVVNVGSRQSGRDQGPNILDCRANSEDVRMTVETVLSLSFRNKAKSSENIYGDGLAAFRITEAVGMASALPMQKNFEPISMEEDRIL